MYTILHLEQSDFIKKVVKNMLLEKGFSYIAADTANEAFEILNDDTNNISLIITSLLISDTTIEDFMKTLNKSKVKDIPVFVITSSDIADDKKRVLNLGVCDYIKKDNLVDELLKHIEVLMKSDELTNDLRECKIAVVDDSAFDIKVVQDILETNNITNVDYYSSGKDLLDSNKKYDIYLIDIVLENEFGKNVIVQIRKNNLDASIVILSSLTNTKTLSSILNAGANDYVRKPIQEDLFIAKLKSNTRHYNLLKKMKLLIKEINS